MSTAVETGASCSAITRFTAIFYGKLPSRVGPIRSARLIDLELPAMYDAALLTGKPGALAYRLRVEREYADLLERVIQGAPLYQSLDATNPEAILRLIDQGRATHQPGRFHAFLAACQALWPVHGDRFTTKLMRAVAAVKSISGTPLIKQGLSGKALKLSLTGQRLAAIERIFE